MLRDKGNHVERVKKRERQKGDRARSWLLQKKLGGLREVAWRQAANATDRLCPD